MLRFFTRFFAVVGFLMVAGVAAAAFFAFERREAAPERIVLALDLSRNLAETSLGGLSDAVNRHATLTDMLDALERAEQDPRVKGVAARFSGDAFGYAKAHDLRAAVERLRASGRFAIAYADSFGEGESGALALSVAAAFDQIWLQPMGMASANWPALEVPFARDALESIGVAPQMEKREAYKTFADTFTERGLTPPHREMLTALTAGLGDELVGHIARGRKLPADAVRALMSASPLSDVQALEGRLVDRLAYRDEALAEAGRRAGPDAELMHPLDYLALAGPPHADGALVAVIHAVGEIFDGGEDNAAFDELNADARRLIRAFEEAAEDPQVRAILLRIDSPGGSATASESIRRAMTQAKKAGKPVVVSMGDTAASGGYWIAMGADRIIAAPGTLTGSIGVVTGKFPLEGAFAKLGVQWGRVSGGPGGGFWSPIEPLSVEARQRMATLADGIYAAFLTRVAESRHMTPAQARAVAQGRVWTGAQALEHGLVDELGGRREALAAVRRLAGLSAQEPLELAPYPAPLDFLEQLQSLLGHDGGFVEMLRLSARLAAIAPQVEKWAALAGISARSPVGPTAAMPALGGLPAAGYGR